MKLLIVANWKCNPTTIAEAKELFNLVKKGVKNIKKAEIVICPPFVYLATNNKQQAANLKLGAQNCFWEKKGAYTGEVSSSMLRDVGCKYVIVGHSERRRYFKETDEMINRKIKAVLEEKLNPILCIGETKEEKEQGKTDRILRKQIEMALRGISKFKINPPGSKQQNSKFSIAYEPIWAIGTGEPCDVEEAQKIGLLIRKIISRIYNRSLSKKLLILYGGSVNSKNAAGYIKEANLQGLLVGGASLKAKEFVKIVKAAS